MVDTMQLETKFLRLRIPVTIGSRFDDWTVSWIGGWSKHRLHYLVMVVRVKPAAFVTTQDRFKHDQPGSH